MFFPMKTSLSAATIIATMFATQVCAQQLYAEGDAAKDLYEGSDAEISTSQGGGLRVQTKQVSDNVYCEEVTLINAVRDTVYEFNTAGEIVVIEEGEYLYENPSYECFITEGLFLG